MVIIHYTVYNNYSNNNIIILHQITFIRSVRTILCKVMGMPLDFNQERMPILRKIMMEELSNGSLVYAKILMQDSIAISMHRCKNIFQM